jgi:hypothetical protein
VLFGEERAHYSIGHLRKNITSLLMTKEAASVGGLFNSAGPPRAKMLGYASCGQSEQRVAKCGRRLPVRGVGLGGFSWELRRPYFYSRVLPVATGFVSWCHAVAEPLRGDNILSAGPPRRGNFLKEGARLDL